MNRSVSDAAHEVAFILILVGFVTFTLMVVLY